MVWSLQWHANGFGLFPVGKQRRLLIRNKVNDRVLERSQKSYVEDGLEVGKSEVRNTSEDKVSD